jgi:hypothetical protein
MGILKAIIKTVVEVPIAVVKDVVTLGGVAIDKRASLPKKYKEILKEFDNK